MTRALARYGTEQLAEIVAGVLRQARFEEMENQVHASTPLKWMAKRCVGRFPMTRSINQRFRWHAEMNRRAHWC